MGKIRHFYKKALVLTVLTFIVAMGFTFHASAQAPERGPDLVVYVLGTGGAGIQDANVTLWQCAYGRQAGPCKNIQPLKSSKTLTISCGFSNNNPGLYNITAERGGIMGYAIVELTPGGGRKNVYVIIDEKKASPRAPPRYLRQGITIPPMPPPMLPGPQAVQPPPMPPSAPAWLEPLPWTDYYGHGYNITSTYYVTLPTGASIPVDDVMYNDSIKGIVTDNGYFTIKKGDDGYWHYINFYTGNLSGKAGIDMPASSDSGGVYEGPPSGRLSRYYPYVPRPAYIDPSAELSGIAGMVSDRSGHGVPGVNITVYHCTLNRLTWEYIDLGMALAPANPQSSLGDRDSAAGTYAIPYLPPGTYRVVAEKEGHMASTIVSLEPKKGTATANITINATV